MLAYAVNNKVPCVICTTGFSKDQIAKIEDAAKTIPVFYSGNMSLGINLLIELSKEAAKFSETSSILKSLKSIIISSLTLRAEQLL